MMNEKYSLPLYLQCAMFAKEILRMIDEGESITIEDACHYIEDGKIVEFVNEQVGFKNINVTVETVSKVNQVLAGVCVSANKACENGIENNGLVYIVNIIVGDYEQMLFNMDNDEINLGLYRAR